MTVIAKFYVQKAVPRADGSSTAAEINMGAVCRGVENAGWASATPYGNIKLGTLNDQAAAYFEEGAEYEVTFVRVEKPMPGDGHKPSPVLDKYGSTLCATCGAYLDGKNFNDENRQTALANHEKVYG